MLDIGPIERARRKGQMVRGRADTAALFIRQCAEPVEEIVRPIGKGAHIARPDIEQVPGIAGGIGEPAAELGAALDQIDLVLGLGLAKEMDSEQRAAESGSDDGDLSALLVHPTLPAWHCDQRGIQIGRHGMPLPRLFTSLSSNGWERWFCLSKPGSGSPGRPRASAEER